MHRSTAENMRSIPFLLLLGLPVLSAQVAPQSNYEVLEPVPAANFIPAVLMTNTHCTVAPMAQTDGLHLTYTLQSPAGTESIVGTQSLITRVTEMKALVALDEIDNSEEFGKALLKAGAEKVGSVRDVVKDPLGTVQRLPLGASRLLGRVSTSVKNAAEGNADPRAGAQQVLGVRRMKNELAARFGVSPYSRNALLQNKLDATARAMAGGALVVNLSGLMFTGGVGTAISVVGVNQTLQRTLIESTPEEMAVKNRAILLALKAAPDAVEGFLSNPSLSPWQKTILTAELKDIGLNPDPFLRLASKPATQEEVLDEMQIMQILLKHHKEIAPIVSIISISEVAGALAALDANGTLVTPVSADLILWSATKESGADALLKMAKEDPRVKHVTLVTDGLVSARAMEEFDKRGIFATPQALGPLR